MPLDEISQRANDAIFAFYRSIDEYGEKVRAEVLAEVAVARAETLLVRAKKALSQAAAQCAVARKNVEYCEGDMHAALCKRDHPNREPT